MSISSHSKTQISISHEIKLLQNGIKDVYNIIENNAPVELLNIRRDNPADKTLDYVEALRRTIKESETPILTDSNILTCQFLTELKEKTKQVEELTAYTRGCVNDLDSEINRLKTQIKMAQEAKSLPRTKMREVKPEHFQKAKKKFQMMKSELHGLINSLFPNNAHEMIELLGKLMQERLDETSNGYIPVTIENYQLIKLLKDADIVTENPYNNMEAKMSY